GFDLEAGFLVAAGRASVRAEVAADVRDYVVEGVSGTAIAVRMGELPELRDAMGLAWRILLLWLAVLALFVLAGWVACVLFHRPARQPHRDVERINSRARRQPQTGDQFYARAEPARTA